MITLGIIGHLGLGDHIVTNGLVRHFAANAFKNRIVIPVKYHNVKTVREMHSDLDCVVIWPVSGDEEASQMLANEEKKCAAICFRLGLFSGHPDAVNPGWDRLQYQQVNVPFEKRWSGFGCPSLERWKHGKFFNQSPFLHDDRKRGFGITKDGLKVTPYCPEPSIPFWDHLPMILGAPEIHCIDSAFACLVDSLPENPNQRLVLHKYARPGGVMPTYKRNWEILE